MDEWDSATAKFSVDSLGKLGCVLCFQHLLVPCDAKYTVTATSIMIQISLMDSFLLKFACYCGGSLLSAIMKMVLCFQTVICFKCITYNVTSLLCSDAYLQRLRKNVAMAKEGNQKVSGEISLTAETTFNGWFIYLPCFSFLNSDSLLG